MGTPRRCLVACCRRAPAPSTKRRKCPCPSGAVRDTLGGLRAPKQATKTRRNSIRSHNRGNAALRRLVGAACRSYAVWSGCVSFRVCEFLISFRRIDFFDHYLVVLEQILEKLLVRFQPTSVGPLAANGVTNFSQLRQTPLGPFFHEDKMHAVAGFDRTEPLPDRNVAQLRRELVAELFCDLGGRRRFEPVLEKEGIA